MARKARRGRGEGAIFESKSEKRWVVRVTIGGKRYVGYARTKELAKLKLLNLQSKANRGLLGPQAEQRTCETVEQIVRDYVAAGIALKTRKHIGESTADRYEGIIKYKIAPEFGSLPVRQLTRAHLEEFFAREHKKNAPASVLKTYNLIRAALQRAVERKLIDENVCHKNLRPAAGKQEAQAFSEDERTALLNYARATNHRDFRLLVVALWTGLRSGELLGLQWSDVDLKLATLKVNHTLANFGSLKSRKLGTPKSRKTRAVPLSVAAVEALKQQREFLMARGHPRPWVFPNSEGGPMNSKHLLRRFKALCNDAEVPVLDVHALRHTFASLALKAGMDYKSLQTILGHYSVALTIDTYTHLEVDAQRSAVEKMEDYLSRTAS